MTSNVDEKRRWPWIAKQRWNDVLFIHWPVPCEVLHPFVPEPLNLDTYAGQAWISVVLFQASDSRLRGMPKFMSYRPFLQLNLRTYVKFTATPGVYFFSLDANSHVAVNVARIFSLPYLKAQMTLTQTGDKRLFTSRRTHKGVPPASFTAGYRPFSKPYVSKKRTLTYWLTERYIFWAIRGNKVLKGSLSHRAWELQETKLDMEMDRLVHFLPETYFQEPPLAHYAKTMKSYLHPFELKDQKTIS